MEKKKTGLFAALKRQLATTEEKKDFRHETVTDKESQLKMANAKKTWLIEYQQEREAKREYIRKNVVAEGLDLSALLQKMQDTKGKYQIATDKVESLIPSFDDFTMTELTNLVDEMSHEKEKDEKDPELTKEE